jgi:hypothetical protein
MWGIGVVINAQGLPLIDVAVCNGAEILRISRIPSQLSNDRHGLDADHAFDREVCLVPDFINQQRPSDTRRQTYGNAPAKSSVEIWLAG